MKKILKKGDPNWNEWKIAVDTVKNPNKGKFMGGPSVDDSISTLKKKFGYSDADIQQLQEVTVKISAKALTEVIRRLTKVELTEGTGNFYNKNAESIFVVGADDSTEGEDGEEDSPVNWSELVDDVYNELDNHFKQKENFLLTSGGDVDDNRSFSATALGTIRYSLMYKSIECIVYTVCVMRSGYYEAANLDWEDFEYELDGYTVTPDDPERLSNILDDASDEFAEADEDVRSDTVSNIMEVFENAASELETELNTAFRKISTPYRVSARFSSGETHYTKESVDEKGTEFYVWWGSKRHSIFAADLWDAKQKAIKQFNVPKSKVGRLAIMSKTGYDNKDFMFENDGDVVTKSNLTNYIMDFEDGTLDKQGTLDLFSYLVKSRMAWSLQGSYGRYAAALIDNGFLSKQGDIIKVESRRVTSESSQVDYKRLMVAYKQNESRNQHIENIRLLCKHFGTDAENERVDQLSDKISDLGHVPSDIGAELYKINKKYYPRFVALANGDQPTTSKSNVHPIFQQALKPFMP